MKRDRQKPKLLLQPVKGKDNVAGSQGCIKLVSVVSRIPDKLLMVCKTNDIENNDKKGGSKVQTLNIRQLM